MPARQKRLSCLTAVSTLGVPVNIQSIKVKIVALSVVCLVTTVAAVVGYGVFASKTLNERTNKGVSQLLDAKSREALQAIATTQAGDIRAEVDTAFAAARNMARALEAMVGDSQSATPAELRRAQLNATLLNVLKDNPRFNGTYSAWVADGIDGNDAAFKGKTNVGSDQTGRALPYWTRDSAGKIALQPLVEYDSRESHENGLMKGGWFIGPQETGKESILAPLPYIVQGKAVHLSTMSVPISVNGKFLGVAGADFDLSAIQKLAEAVNSQVYGGGRRGYHRDRQGTDRRLQPRSYGHWRAVVEDRYRVAGVYGDHYGRQAGHPL